MLHIGCLLQGPLLRRASLERKHKRRKILSLARPVKIGTRVAEYHRERLDRIDRITRIDKISVWYVFKDNNPNDPVNPVKLSSFGLVNFEDFEIGYFPEVRVEGEDSTVIFKRQTSDDEISGRDGDPFSAEGE
jgi:hypothetical protein